MSEWLRIKLLQVLILTAVLTLWEFGARSGWWDATWTSTPLLLWRSFWDSLLSGEILRHTGVTLAEAFSGLLAGTVVGVSLGVLLSISRVFGAAMEPYVIALNSLPRVALAPLIVMYVGIGFMSKFLLSFSLVVVPMMISTYEGIRAAEPIWLNAMKVFRASRLQVFVKVLLPNCVPWIFSAIRVSISLSIVGAIVGEFISARAGIGYMIDHAAGGFDITGMLMPLLVLMGVAFALDRLVLLLSRQLMRWRDA
ncbi:ABC transporter permease [Alcaligenaceae bacterium]|nr:ABC transporter permease [Alcaligenaceae bacterium]